MTKGNKIDIASVSVFVTLIASWILYRNNFEATVNSNLIFGGLIFIPWGILFLVSYFFSEGSYLLRFCRWCSWFDDGISTYEKGKYKLIINFLILTGVGAFLLLIGTGLGEKF